MQKLASSAQMSKVAAQLNYADLDTLYAAIGEGHLSAKAVVQRVQRDLRGGEEQLPVTVARPPRARSRSHADVGVHVEGLDDVMVRLSRCCTPVPGDEIMGFVTRGRGVSVHRTDCANALSLRSQADRVIDVEWDNDAPGNYVVSVEIEALDRSRLLRDVADVLSEHHVNIIVVHLTDPVRPHRPAPLRLRARRPRPSRLDPRWRSSASARSTKRCACCPAHAPDHAPSTPERIVRTNGSDLRTRRRAEGATEARPDSPMLTDMSPSPARTPDTDAGFTIIEVVVASTLLLVAFVAAAGLFVAGTRVSGDTRMRVVAAQLASSAIEAVRGPAADPSKFTTAVQPGTTVTTKTVNGLKFTITQQMQWVAESSTASAVTAAG